ncbi:MAG: heme o synthase [bacterium]
MAWIHRILAGLLTALAALLCHRGRREPRPLFLLSVAAFAMVLVQDAVGARIALYGPEPAWTGLHLALGAAAVGLFAVAAVAAWARPAGTRDAGAVPAGAASALYLLLVGLDTRGASAVALACGLALAIRSRRQKEPQYALVAGGVAGLAGVDLVGRHVLGPAAGPLTAVSAVGVAGGLGALTALLWFRPSLREPRAAVPLSARVRAYWQLTKPRVVLLLLVTAGCAMVAARGLWVPVGLVLATVLGGAFAAAGANALNCVIDRDVDAVMHRTRTRPLVTGRVGTTDALLLGILLGLASFAVLATAANLLAATLAAIGYLFYVLVYSIWLKRATDQNIVIGGAAGAVPPLVGWAAASGQLDVLALGMFLVVFLWTPPHFWALALARREDYARAGIPMLPVVRGEERTRKQILTYTVLLIASTLALGAVGAMGWLYWLSALLPGAALLVAAWRLRRDGTGPAAWSLFKFSNVYLALLFVSMALDRLGPKGAV